MNKILHVNSDPEQLTPFSQKLQHCSEFPPIRFRYEKVNQSREFKHYLPCQKAKCRVYLLQ